MSVSVGTVMFLSIDRVTPPKMNSLVLAGCRPRARSGPTIVGREFANDVGDGFAIGQSLSDGRDDAMPAEIVRQIGAWLFAVGCILLRINY
jgi:hypothetical protein